MKKIFWRAVTAAVTGVLICAVGACGPKKGTERNLVTHEDENRREVNMFGPTDRSNPDAVNTARTAQEQTVIMAEKELGLTVQFRTYTAEDYKDRTYDDVCVDRVRANIDDMYLLNPDTLQLLGEENLLADLSGLPNAENLRDVVKVSNTVNGKLVGIPQEIVVYGLFINQDIFDRCGLKLPNTPEEFKECCRVLKKNGYDTPIGANRWWLETFVLAQAYADLYNGGNTEAEIAALNSGEARYSDYMRPGFAFLKDLMDLGYIDAEKVSVSEAIEAEGADFLAQKTPIVMAYWGAANTETAYGKTDFEMQVIGFPSSRGQMPVITMTGLAVGAEAEHREDALQVLNVMLSDEALQVYSETNRVISPSKNVKVDCVPALEPLNDRIEKGVYVLGSNAGMKVEQWGSTCLIVRELLAGAAVEECMAAFDRLQDEALAK